MGIYFHMYADSFNDYFPGTSYLDASGTQKQTWPIIQLEEGGILGNPGTPDFRRKIKYFHCPSNPYEVSDKSTNYSLNGCILGSRTQTAPYNVGLIRSKIQQQSRDKVIMMDGNVRGDAASGYSVYNFTDSRSRISGARTTLDSTRAYNVHDRNSSFLYASGSAVHIPALSLPKEDFCRDENMPADSAWTP